MNLKNRVRPGVIWALLVVLLVTAALSTACSDPEKAKAEHLSRGEAYLKENPPKFQEASIEFRNAVQIDDRLAGAHWGLARAYEGLERYQESIEELARTIQLDQNNLEARVKMGNYLMLVRPPQIDEAERLAKEVLEKDPNDIEGHILMATVLYGRDPQKNREAALNQLNDAIRIDPNRVESHLSIGRFYEQIGDLTKAEESLRRALSINDKSSLAYFTHAGFLVRRNRPDEAEVQLKKAVEVDPLNRQMRRVLADFYLVNLKQVDKAEEVYKALADLDRDKPEGRAVLADFYSAVGRHDEAIKTYQDILAKSPDYNRAHYRLSEIMLQRGDAQGAMKQVDDVLQKNPRDKDALLLRARMTLQRGEAKKAIEDLKEVLNQEPRDRNALYLMTEANLRAGQVDQARAFAGDLERFHSEYLPAKLMQVQVSLAAGDARAAQNLASELLDRLSKTVPSPQLSPQLLAELRLKALTARGSANVQLKNMAAARADMQAARDAAPNAPATYVNLASLALAEGKTDEAQQLYERALQIDGTNFDALNGVTKAYGGAGRADQAHARVDQALSARPDDPALHFLKAQVYGFERKSQEAEASLRRALEVSKGEYLPAYSSLGALYINTQQPERALAEYRKITERRPDDAMTHTMMGMVEYGRGNQDAAIESYKRALAINPNEMIAANNLAAVYAEHDKGNLDEAVRLAQGVVQQNPDQAGFADTLGWVYYKKGLHAAAVEQLQRAVSKSVAMKGDNALYRFHLGMALAGANRKADARRELDAALRLAEQEAARGAKPFAYADEARRTLASL